MSPIEAHQNTQSQPQNCENSSSHVGKNIAQSVETLFTSPEVAKFFCAIESSELLSPMLRWQIDRLYKLNMLDTSIIQSYFSPNSNRYSLEEFLNDFSRDLQSGENGEFNEYKPRIFLTTADKNNLKDIIVWLEDKEFYGHTSSSDEVQHYDL